MILKLKLLTNVNVTKENLDVISGHYRKSN
jgi:hypothetical protein